MKVTDEEKILELISERTYTDANGCWLWMGTLSPKGYAHQSFSNKPHRMHIISYNIYVGQVKGELHHKCLIRHCINPAHLQDVPPDVNQKFSKGWTLGDDGIWSCKRGHRMEGYNVKKAGNGGICCRECANLAKRMFDRGYSLKS